MDDKQDLITELLENGKKQTRLIRNMMIVTIILAAGVLIALGILVPRTLKMINEAQTAAQDAGEMVREAQQILSDNASDMEQALDNFNSVDFESLNRTILDLADAVEPLANLSRLFN